MALIKRLNYNKNFNGNSLSTKQSGYSERKHILVSQQNENIPKVKIKSQHSNPYSPVDVYFPIADTVSAL